MTIEVKAPMLPESVADATVSKWYKKPGDAVKRDENLVDLETDKVMLEVPALKDGVLTKILKTEGSRVKAQEVLAVIEEGAVSAQKVEAKPAAQTQMQSTPAANKSSVTTTTNAELSPSVRRAVAENELDASKITGTGKNNRITHEDVMNFVGSQNKTATTSAVSGARPEKRVPMSRLRARIAERLLAAKNSTAMLTTFNEVNMKAIMDLRAEYKEQFEQKYGVKLGLMSFFVKAALEALKLFPVVNSSLDGEDIIYHGYYDIGIAVSTERGLVVPIIRDADTLSLAAIEKAIIDYSEKARSGKLSMEEITGGTFTITNGGVFGSMLSTPILNPPQCAILGMHNIVKRPVVENDQVVIRPMMYLALSYDHRLIDGRESVNFLVTIKQMLEDPMRLMLEV